VQLFLAVHAGDDSGMHATHTEHSSRLPPWGTVDELAWGAATGGEADACTEADLRSAGVRQIVRRNFVSLLSCSILSRSYS
jgi:hypothetical protein